MHGYGYIYIHTHMGNNLGSVSLLNYMHFPYHIQLGRYAAIDATEEVDDVSDMRSMTVKYTVDGSTCELCIIIYPSHDEFMFELCDDICSGSNICFDICKTDENDLLKLGDFKYKGRFADMMKLVKTTETHNSCGGVTKTNVFFYGNGNKGGLLVVEQKRKNGDKKPYKVTVAHYYAASSGNMFSQTKIDIGLSMVLNIRVSSNKLDVTVEGPLQHLSSALIYMFEQVCKTGIWKPMVCPHCANLRQSSSKFWQSESEDSDGLPPARIQGPKRNATSVLANDGAVRGNNNGNLIVRKFINYGGRYLK